MNKIAIPEGMKTEVFVMEDGALTCVPQVVNEYFSGQRPWIVADENTWGAAGEKLFDIFEKSGLAPFKPYIFPAHPMPHGDMKHIPALREAMPKNSLPVAVGSGTINDLVKRASGEADIRYLCVPTAPSVDGYTSAGAALVEDGLKKTMACPPPSAVVADTSVLYSAPREMFAAGYADLMAKSVAGADWIIVDELGFEPIDKKVWALVQNDLRSWLEHPEDVSGVFKGLAVTGYAMQIYFDSRPASGAEHMFSHVWEMENLELNGEPVSHGFKVAIGTLAIDAVMNILFSMSAEEARSLAKAPVSLETRKAEIDMLLARNCYGGEAPVKIAIKKFIEGEAAYARRELIFSKWENIRKRVFEQIYPFETLKKMLSDVNCPTTPSEIGLDREQLYHAVKTAQLIRNRYTVLDLAYETGLYEVVIQRLGDFIKF